MPNSFIRLLGDPPGQAIRLVDNGDGTYSMAVSTGAGGGGTQYTSAAATPASPIGTAVAYDESGTIRIVSLAKPLPVNLAVALDYEDTVNHAARVVGGFAEQTGLTAGALNANLVPPTDVSIYRSFSLQVGGTFVGTLTFQGSNDNVNFFNTSVVTTDTTSSPAPETTTVSGAVLASGPIMFRYLRVRMTSYTSGTATGTLALSALPYSPINIGIGGQVNVVGGFNLGNSLYNVAWPANVTGVNIRTFTLNLYDYVISNTAATARYVKLYNKSSAPVTGTDVPVMRIYVAAGSTISLASTVGISFGNGLGVAVTTGVADADTTAPAANDVLIHLAYK